MNLIKLKKVFAYLLLACLAWVVAKTFVRPGIADYKATLATSAPAQSNDLKITWFGVATVLIDDGEHRLLIDPFFSRSDAFNTLLNLPIKPREGLATQWLKKAGVDSVDAALVSHSHYDHILDIGQLGNAAIYGSETTLNIALGHGVEPSNIRVINPNQRYNIGPYIVTFIETPHAGATGGRPLGELTTPLAIPARPWNYKLGATYSLHIEHPKASLLHVGSAGITPESLQGLTADTVLLGLALRPELNYYLQETAYAVGAKNVVPIHWDDFFRPLNASLRPLPFGANLDDFFENMRDHHPQLNVISAPIGQPIIAAP